MDIFGMNSQDMKSDHFSVKDMIHSLSTCLSCTPTFDIQLLKTVF